MPVISSISGLRATLKDGLTPQLITNYVSAFCKLIPEGEIVVGRDGRPSGRWIEQIVIGTAISCGRKVRLIGIVPTPTVQLEVEHSGAAGGIAITASHNPEQWNGLKFLNKDGVFLDSDEINELWKILENKDFRFTDNFDQELMIDLKSLERHVDTTLSIVNEQLLKIYSKKYKVVVDAVNASASIVIPYLLRKMGCEVIELYCDNDGNFPHIPEPLPVNLNDLCQKLKECNADIGLAIDPDGDRLVIIDENGNPIGEELTITLAVKSILMDNNSSNVVVNYSTTGLVEKVAENYNSKVFRSPVGEINVVKKMKEVGALIGGEGSGGVILPKSHYGRDSLIGTALILKLMTSTGKKISELANELPKVAMLKTKFDLNFDFKELQIKIEELFNGYEFQKEDGIRIVFEDGWMHIRTSNTEPIIRIIAEFETIEKSNEMIEKVKNLLN